MVCGHLFAVHHDWYALATGRGSSRGRIGAVLDWCGEGRAMRLLIILLLVGFVLTGWLVAFALCRAASLRDRIEERWDREHMEVCDEKTNHERA